MDNVVRLTETLGLKHTLLRRKMMDLKAAAEGRENISTPREMMELLEQLYRGKVIGPPLLDDFGKTSRGKTSRGKTSRGKTSRGETSRGKTPEPIDTGLVDLAARGYQKYATGRLSASIVSVVTITFTVLKPTSIAAIFAPAPIAAFAPMASTVIDRRGRIVTWRFIHHRRGRSPPTERVEVDSDACVGVGGGACGQRQCDHAK
jgi:hypothetical protein